MIAHDYKILIISHNPLSETSNMGKTIGAFVRSFKLDNVAQLYLHQETPNSPYCNNYYCFTDKDALKSILLRWLKGNVISKKYNFEEKRDTNFGSLYKIGRYKSPIICMARDIIWSLSNIFNSKLKKWAKDFNPDFIFFASGESVFSYKIARRISKYLNKPLVTICMDDYYIQVENEGKMFSKYYHKKLLNNAKKLFNQSSCTFSFNEEMSLEYGKLFNREFPVLYNAASKLNEVDIKNKEGISYLGGLGLKRDDQLISIANSLQNIKLDGFKPKMNVYSNGLSQETKLKFDKCPIIEFMGSAGALEVKNIISNSKCLLHVESFDEKLYGRLRYSLSTKIPESLGSHTLLVAFGPKGLASMNYLKKYDAAIVSDNIDELISKLSKAIGDEKEYKRIIGNAYRLYLQNHTPEAVAEKFIFEIQKAIRRQV